MWLESSSAIAANWVVKSFTILDSRDTEFFLGIVFLLESPVHWCDIYMTSCGRPWLKCKVKVKPLVGVTWWVCEGVHRTCVSAGTGAVRMDRRLNWAVLLASTCSRQGCAVFWPSRSWQLVTLASTAVKQLTRHHQHLERWCSVPRPSSLCMVRASVINHQSSQSLHTITVVLPVIRTVLKVKLAFFRPTRSWKVLELCCILKH